MHANIRREDFFFPRQQQNPELTTWENKCPPMESLAEMIVGWGIIIVACGAVYEFAMFFLAALKAQGILVIP